MVTAARCKRTAVNQYETPSEVTLSKAHRPSEEADDQDVTGYAIEAWGRTIRLCAIRLAEAVPTLAVALLCVRH
jgi:hypothetical protein